MEVLGQGIEPLRPLLTICKAEESNEEVVTASGRRVPALVSLGGVRRARGGPTANPTPIMAQIGADDAVELGKVESSTTPPEAARGYSRRAPGGAGRRQRVRRCSASPRNYVEHRGNRTGKRKLRSDESTLAQATIVALRAP